AVIPGRQACARAARRQRSTRHRHRNDSSGRRRHPTDRRLPSVLRAARATRCLLSLPQPKGATMSMSVPELERALRSLRLSGMIATLEARALQVAQHDMDFIEAFSCLVQDELDRRRSRLLERRFAHSGLPDRKDLKDFDWSYNARLPKRAVLELATLKFIEAREDALFIGPPGLGKSHCAK